MSEREPELGLGRVAGVDAAARRIAVEFPATGEKRLYALGTPVLKRVQFRAGDTVTTHDGATLIIESVEDQAGVLTYLASGRRVREDALSDVTSVSSPQERLLAGQTDPNEVFDLRLRALEAQARFRQSDVRGFLGGRVDLIPHQIFILHEVASRQIPRVLLADEVGLGKTIEACLIVQRLLGVGKARRVLILVPESLVHQWFVELLRRFNLWFSIYDEPRCVALERSDPGANPFLAVQLALCSVSYLASLGHRRDQAVAAGWDMVVVDEAHHLAWSPAQASPGYVLVEQLAGRSEGLLLLTATPTQLGLTGHFARLRLLDPSRYSDFERFQAEAAQFERVADIAERIIAGRPLTEKDRRALTEIYHRDPERLAQHLADLSGDGPLSEAEALRARVPCPPNEAAAGRGARRHEEKSHARQNLLKTLLDQHGTGRVMLRNTRAAMAGFPSRKFCPAPIAAANNLTLLARIARELRTEETDDLAWDRGRPRPPSEQAAEGGRGPREIRYSFRDDPRIEWLAAFLSEHRAEKILLICKSQRKVAAIEAALQEKRATKSALFHEGLPLVQRDRNAAWFAEPGGAQILLCSEIGSEGRNFQFAHHLVLFDLPLNPGLLEQRIGRLDRIGQTETIRVHVPFIAGSADEVVAEWYQRGLDAFETPLRGGDDCEARFKERLLALAPVFDDGDAEAKAALAALIADTAAFREELTRKLERGRDRLLELSSFNREVAERVIARIRAADADPFLRRFLLALLDHFGVRLKEHEEGDVFLDPSHAYIEGFPSIPADGMLATFERTRAIAREDIRFLSADHALVQDAIDLLLDSKAGTTAFGTAPSDEPNLLLEAVFVLEAVAETRWHVDQFLAPTPVRVLVDGRGDDWTERRSAAAVAADVEDGDVHRFLERPEFNAGLLKDLVETAAELAEARSQDLKRAARAKAETALSVETQRLRDLQKVNDHIRPAEIALAQERLERTCDAITRARLRLDAVRLVVEGMGES